MALFKDTITEYPGRVLVTPVEGAENTYDMTPAEGTVLQAGTKLSAAGLSSAVIDTIKGHVAHGSKSTGTINAGKYKDFTINFGSSKTFSSVPAVVCGLATNSTAVATVTCSALNITKTGFTLRVYNNASSSRSPVIHWIATDL